MVNVEELYGLKLNIPLTFEFFYLKSNPKQALWTRKCMKIKLD